MKRNLLLTLLIVFIGFQYNAQKSTLIVFSEDGAPFDLILNGVGQNLKPETNMSVKGLTQPYYSAKVIFHDKTLGTAEKKNLMVVDADGKNAEVTYVVKKNRKGVMTIKYYSSVVIAEAAAPAPNVTVVEYTAVPRPASTSVTVSETVTTTEVTNPVKETVDVSMNVGGLDVGMNVNVQVSETSSGGTNSETINMNMGGIDMDVQSTHTTTETTMVTHTETIHDGGAVALMPTIGEGCSSLSVSEFAAVKKSIESKDFEDTKLSVAQQVSKSKCLTAMQLKEIMGLFEFESSRLNFAKSAYSTVSDRSNYYQVNDAFEFESSIEELNAYISK